MSRRRADLALIWNTVIWGATFTLVKSAIASVSPVLFLALRFTLAAGVLWLVFRRSGKLTRWRPALGPAAVTGGFLFCGYVFQTQGLRFTTAPRSAFLTGLTSIMVPLLAALVYKNRPQFSELVGVLVAIIGLGLMTLEGFGSSGSGAMVRGDLLTLIGAAGFAAYIVALGHFSEQMGFELLSVAQVSAAAVLSLSSFWWMEKPHVEWRPVVVFGILVTGLLCTALAYTIQAWAQQFISSTRTALIYMLEPIFAWITSYLIVGEGLSVRAAAGAALILGGVLLVEVKPLNARQHPSQ